MEWVGTGSSGWEWGGEVVQWCEHVTNGNGTPNHRRNEMFAGRQCSECQMRIRDGKWILQQNFLILLG